MSEETGGSPADELLLGRYQAEGLLGEGGLGTVVRAFDTRLKRTVAIKTLKQPPTGEDAPLFASLRARFLREAEAGSRMGSHPNVVTVYDLVTGPDKTQHLVLEYVPGGTLADRIRQGSLPVATAMTIAADIARALQAAHDRGIVHRDIKPANIFLTEDGHAKVGDFGVAQIDELSRRTQPTTGHPGTPLYMSPEQASSAGYVRPASDQYSLGLVLFEMLTGTAYKRLEPSHAAALLNPFPAAVREIVWRLLQVDPSRRFPNMSAVLAAVAGGSRTGRPRAASMPASRPPRARATTTTTTRGRDRGRAANERHESAPIGSWLLIAGVFLFVVASVGVATILANQSGGHSAAPTTPTGAAAAATAPATSPPPPAAAPAPTVTPSAAATSTSPPTAAPTAIATPTAAGAATALAACPDQTQVLKTFSSLPGTASVTLLCDNSTVSQAGDQSLPAAGLIKLAIAAEAYHQMAAGTLNPSKPITISQSDAVGGTGNLQSQVGQQFTIDQLVRTLLLDSDNTAGNILIDQLGGFAPINAYAAQLGLQHTQLKRKFLDTKAEAAGIENLTSANDIATFFLKLNQGQVVNSGYSSLMLQILQERGNSDPNWLLAGLQSGETAAHVSGTLSGVRDAGALVDTPRGAYILVVLVRDADEAAAEQAMQQVGNQVHHMMATQ